MERFPWIIWVDTIYLNSTYKKEARGSESKKDDVRMEPKDGEMLFEGRERDHEQWNGSKFWKLKKAKKRILPLTLQKKCKTADTLIFDFWPLKL